MLLNVKNGSAQKGFQEGKSFEYKLNIELSSQHGKSKGTRLDKKLHHKYGREYEEKLKRCESRYYHEHE